MGADQEHGYQAWKLYKVSGGISTGDVAGSTIAFERPLKTFSFEVKCLTAVATAWSVTLQGQIDGTNYTVLITHANTDGDGKILFTVDKPVLGIKINLGSITAGSCTGFNYTVLGVA